MNSFRHWIRMARLYGGIDRSGLARGTSATALSLVTSPLRLAERVLYVPGIRRTEIAEAPVFILGHWRTGTTYLHSLLTQDPNLGFVPLFQTIAPTSFFVGRKTIRPLVAMRAPLTRPMDNVPIYMDGPQEDEYAMANLSPHSFYCGWYFPREMEQLFAKYALFDGISDSERAEWRASYLYLLKTATRYHEGKRLVLKNPVNTSRIPAILELFPNAKFVHICRDPYTVFKSSLRLHRSVLNLVSLQHIDDAAIEANVLKFYRGMMERYLEERHLIPAGNLVEVRYEELEAAPVDIVERVYAGLGLPGWEEAREPVRAYAQSQQSYEKNAFDIGEADQKKVEETWQFALDAWGYGRPGEVNSRRTEREVRA